ncbi:MAG: hypothetical protein Q8914_01745 [Bacteroidota bacterium]|nr:hypothetical protein [Bacteroidota bacterium]
MQGVKGKYSVDALKVCYEISLDVYNKLTINPLKNQDFVFKSPNYLGVLTEDFRLRRVKTEEREFNILVPDEDVTGNLIPYGFLDIKPKEDTKFAGKCFITLDNRRLYEPFVVYHEVLERKKSKSNAIFDGSIPFSENVKRLTVSQPKATSEIQYNTIFYLETMANKLDLKLYSISNLEIALDTNINFARLIKNAVANKDYVPVVNKKRYLDIDSRETINNTHLQYSTTRRRAVNMSYLIKQAKNNLQLKCYNKSREIEDKSHKTYIYRWLDMEKNIHRMEITAKWPAIKSYCRNSNIKTSDFLYNLHTGENLSTPYSIWLNGLIHFKRVGKKEIVSVFDLVKLKDNNKAITSIPERAN